jgi:hypothetical protein
MEIEDYLLLHKGHGNKVLNERRALRWALAPLLQAWASKKISPMKIWPLPDDKKDGMTVEQAKVLLDSHKKLKEKGKPGISWQQRAKALDVISKDE